MVTDNKKVCITPFVQVLEVSLVVPIFVAPITVVWDGQVKFPPTLSRFFSHLSYFLLLLPSISHFLFLFSWDKTSLFKKGHITVFSTHPFLYVRGDVGRHFGATFANIFKENKTICIPHFVQVLKVCPIVPIFAALSGVRNYIVCRMTGNSRHLVAH